MTRKRVILFVLLQFTCSAGFSENPRWEVGTPIPARADLNVRWDASAKKFPSKVWVYHLLPNAFSPSVISNVMTLCSFTETDQASQNTNGMIFRTSDGSRQLSISFPSGNIHYEMAEPNYSPTNLAIGVPPMSQLPELTTNFFKLINLPIRDVTGYFETDKFNLWEPLTEYFIHQTIITNHYCPV